MKNLYIWFLIIFISLISATCVEKSKTVEQKPSQEIEKEENLVVQSISIEEIIKNRNKYLNKEIVITGEFQGWQGINAPPPVSFSDWVIKDQTGAIYVHGPYPEGCRPPDIGIGKVITIKGKIQINDKGAVYILLDK